MTSSSILSEEFDSMTTPSSSNRRFLLGLPISGKVDVPFVFGRLGDGSDSMISSSGADRFRDGAGVRVTRRGVYGGLGKGDGNINVGPSAG